MSEEEKKVPVEAVLETEDAAVDTSENKMVKRKKWKTVLIWSSSIIGALLLLILIFRDTLIENCGAAIGTWVLGVDVNIGEFDSSLFAGKVTVRDLQISNPEGFESPFLVSLGHLHLDLEPGSLFSKKLVIEKIIVEDLVLTGEFNNDGKLNVSVLNEDIQRRFPAEKKDDKEESEEPAVDEEVDKQDLLIKELVFSADAKLIDSRTNISVPLPLRYSANDIEISDDGSSFAEKFNELNKMVISACGPFFAAGGKLADAGKELVSGTGKAAKSLMSDTGDAAKNVVDGTAEAAKSVVDKTKNLFKF